MAVQRQRHFGPQDLTQARGVGIALIAHPFGLPLIGAQDAQQDAPLDLLTAKPARILADKFRITTPRHVREGNGVRGRRQGGGAVRFSETERSRLLQALDEALERLG